jgi:hypothetical protein
MTGTFSHAHVGMYLSHPIPNPVYRGVPVSNSNKLESDISFFTLHSLEAYFRERERGSTNSISPNWCSFIIGQLVVSRYTLIELIVS